MRAAHESIRYLGQSAIPSVTLLNFPKSPFELISGSSPQFTELLTDFAGPDAVSGVRAVTPYLVIVKNNSTTTARSLTVIWATVNASGQPRQTTVQYEVKPGISPGEMALMAPISGLCLYMANSATDQNAAHSKPPTLRNTPLLNDTMANFLRNYTQGPEVSISLDSVVFRDNTFLGPDHAGKFEEENRERRIKREIVTELLHRAPSERSAYLRETIDDPQSQNALADSELGQRHRIAEMLLPATAPGRDEALFRRSMENILNDEAHPLRRGTQSWTEDK